MNPPDGSETGELRRPMARSCSGVKMLELLRRVGEKIILIVNGTDVVEIEVLRIKGDNVRLGITAPQFIQINREEVWRKSQASIET